MTEATETGSTCMHGCLAIFRSLSVILPAYIVPAVNSCYGWSLVAGINSSVVSVY